MNILVLTSVYPSTDDKNENTTKVVQYFAKEWVKQGHVVKVIHNAHKYPWCIHFIPKRIKYYLASKINFYIPDSNSVKYRHFYDGEIEIWRLPILKLRPHGDHFKRSVKKQAQKISQIMKVNNFTPDILMGHWMSPQIQLIKILKDTYDCRTSLVLHGRGYINGGKFNCTQYLDAIDALGCRSGTESKYVKRALGLKKEPFICYSGVPEDFLGSQLYNKLKFKEKPVVWNIVCIGRLISMKNIDQILKALSESNMENYILHIIGEGSEEKNLKRLACVLGIAEKVVFHGSLPRNEVQEYLRRAQLFVLASSGEVFGLVYLEAMAASCVTVGSLGEGIDGVIVNRKNGYLVKPGDTKGLSELFSEVTNMSCEELERIAKNGYTTATLFTDEIVAKRYLYDALNA